MIAGIVAAPAGNLTPPAQRESPRKPRGSSNESPPGNNLKSPGKTGHFSVVLSLSRRGFWPPVGAELRCSVRQPPELPDLGRLGCVQVALVRIQASVVAHCRVGAPESTPCASCGSRRGGVNGVSSNSLRSRARAPDQPRTRVRRTNSGLSAAENTVSNAKLRPSCKQASRRSVVSCALRSTVLASSNLRARPCAIASGLTLAQS